MNPFAKALEKGLFSVEKVCQDCVMAKENGDTSGNDPDWNYAAYDEVLEEYEVTIGHPHGNQWHTECHHHGERCPEDCDCERDPYSTTECAMCGTHLHGERHDYIFIERTLL